jgi:hypothetical protein
LTLGLETRPADPPCSSAAHDLSLQTVELGIGDDASSFQVVEAGQLF